MQSNYRHLFFLAILIFYISSIQKSNSQIKPFEAVLDTTGYGVPDTNELHDKDILDVLFKRYYDKKKSKPPKEKKHHKVYFSVIPGASSAGGDANAFVTSTNAAFFTGSRKNTNLSAFYFYVLYNFRNQLSIPISSNIWLSKNKWNLIGDWRYSTYRQNTYGLGGHTPRENRTMIDYNHFRFHQAILKQIYGSLLGGIGYNLDYRYKIEPIEEDISRLPNLLTEGFENVSNTTSSGISLNILWDSRRNFINPRGGHYISGVFNNNFKFLGSTSPWSSLYGDFRKYFPIRTKNNSVLAFWAFSWATFGKTPYFDQPAVGWDNFARSGRGYRQGRYRGKAMFYTETEYRFDIFENGLLGGVVFANSTIISKDNEPSLKYIHPGIGLGLRIKINRVSGTNLALDYGFGDSGGNFYINLSEYF